MWKINLCYFLLLLASDIFAQNLQALKSGRVFSAEELNEDLQFWRNLLENKHPLLYRYATKEEVDSAFAKLEVSLSDSMDAITFYRQMSELLSCIKDGHNGVLPAEEDLMYVRSLPDLLPIEITLLGDSLFVARNDTPNRYPPVGAQVLAIEGFGDSVLIETFRKHLPQEGLSTASTDAEIAENFRYYWHIQSGHQPTYTLTWKYGDVLQTSRLQGVSLDTLKARKAATTGRAVVDSLAYYTDSTGIGYLYIPTFHGPYLRTTYRQHFKKEIRRAFNYFEEEKIGGLIIDVRGNGGGNPVYVKQVLRQVCDGKFRMAYETYRVKNPEAEVFEERNASRWYPGYGLGHYKARKNAYQGPLVLLTDGGSFSAAVNLAAVLKRYQRAYIIGSETGGDPILHAGYLIRTGWQLPHTQIQVSPANIAARYGDFGMQTGYGLMPDLTVRKSAADMMKQHDSAVDKAREYLLQMGEQGTR